MIWVILTFLFFSAVFYSVFAGADFGAGIVEVFGPKNKKRELIQAINKALGPVWEANHMWIILIIVIMQIAFPSLYSQVSIYFHIPITLALFGIILRGCGFAFRYYDPEPEKPENEIFGFIFKFSSFWTPLAYGLVIAGLISGRVDPAANDFFGRFIDPWFSFFGVFVGLFIISLWYLTPQSFNWFFVNNIQSIPVLVPLDVQRIILFSDL